MINHFVTEADRFLNLKEIAQFSEYFNFKNFQFFVECMKKIKIFLLGLHLDNIENEWIKELKGDLIPLNCGHILFYDRELDTIKNIINETFNGNLGQINNEEMMKMFNFFSFI